MKLFINLITIRDDPEFKLIVQILKFSFSQLIDAHVIISYKDLTAKGIIGFSLCLLISSKTSHRHQWFIYLLPDIVGYSLALRGNGIPLLFSYKKYNHKHSVLQILFPYETIGEFFLLKLFACICLPHCLICMKFTAALSHYTAHRIDISV